jgi:hypothetical protein
MWLWSIAGASSATSESRSKSIATLNELVREVFATHSGSQMGNQAPPAIRGHPSSGNQQKLSGEASEEGLQGLSRGVEAVHAPRAAIDRGDQG